MECTHFEPKDDEFCVGIATVYSEVSKMEYHFLQLFKKNDRFWVRIPARKLDTGEYKNVYGFRDPELNKLFLKGLLDAILKKRSEVLQNQANERSNKNSSDFNDEILF